MLGPPKTKAEAEKYRYGAILPKGNPYSPSRCAYAVWHDMFESQCSRKSGFGPDGLYCLQHSKKVG